MIRARLGVFRIQIKAKKYLDVVSTTVNQYSCITIVSIDNIRTFSANMNLLIVALKTQRKTSLWPVQQRVQINLILIDNVRISCLSCNVINCKTTTKGPCRNKCRSNSVQWYLLQRPRLYCYSPLPSLYVHHVPLKLYCCH